ncbi:predicted protein [Aspergillus nidulans FGSC A4]|uniref:Xylanolytic transcriptional activator regulatory domain-containing protein n=1 Tax=Emericella nidulans (strain FGSC A4 / ATCC 38163 / CBS 112.46 / NRRL 194 / M139) TaxID=227321 RepID=Q5AVU6_EMENI|nr:hypothetical protein [Aspergillus nidulans FGSC A4]EAA62164.1 predicted protein [Aspergillus nidulans FGSC A4]CBF79677.1 TPA: conserved hypothetical protein [Aspergillus nidulans FGSC A4]|eukprot:XP_680853.1 predicted protein [Aspergillus nidulans FGSC A4]
MSSAKEALRSVLALTNKGYRPACSACIGWGVGCVYASDHQPSMDYGFPTPDSTLGMDLAAFVQNMPGAASFDFTPDLALTSSEANHGVPGLESNSPMPMVDQLPLAGQTVQLIDEFFVRCHPQLPCIHKETFLARTQGPVPMPLEWAILATAARAHRGATAPYRADMFLQAAVNSLAQSPLLRENVLRDLQAAVWCVYSLYYSGEITRAVMLLAQAYSLACLNGLDRLDEPGPNVPATMHLSPIEKEECRGTLWALFVLDRQINYLMGRHFVIDDVRWCVNYPLDDASLQSQPGLRPDLEPERCYSSDLAALAWEKPNIAIGTALPRLVCKASVMIGRIATYKSINPMPSATHSAQKRQADFHELQSALACLWVSLPACVHNVSEVPPGCVNQSVWLLITLHTCSTLLFYITDAERRSPGSDQYPTERENFTCTYKSVNKVVTALRALSGLATDAILNPMLAPSYFSCCRFILLQWRRSQQQEFRLDLGLVLRLLEQMANKQAGMARIYKEIIEQELGRDLDVQGGGDLGQALVKTEYCFMI